MIRNLEQVGPKHLSKLKGDKFMQEENTNTFALKAVCFTSKKKMGYSAMEIIFVHHFDQRCKSLPLWPKMQVSTTSASTGVTTDTSHS